MKKILLFFPILIAMFLVYDELSFNPLSKDDFHKLFSSYSQSPEVVIKNDYVGLSMHGEFFNVFCYKIDNAKLNIDNFKISSWENKPIDDSAFVKSWTKTPIGLPDKKKNDMLFVGNVNTEQWYEQFNKELFKSGNYYSYIDMDGAEQYFMLYIPKTNELYYFRKNGI